MLVPRYQATHFLDNKTFSVVEINYIKNSAKPTDNTLYWLFYDKNNDMLLPLELKSSENKEGKKIFIFEESELRLDSKTGTYKDAKTSINFAVLDATKPIYRKLKEAIDDYILLLSLKNR